MLLGKLEGNIDAVGERRKLQEEVLSVWGGGIQYTSENRYYDRSIHTGCAAVPEGKAVWTVNDTGTPGDMVLGGVRSFFSALFLFSERRGKAISSKSADNVTKKKVCKEWNVSGEIY